MVDAYCARDTVATPVSQKRYFYKADNTNNSLVIKVLLSTLLWFVCWFLWPVHAQSLTGLTATTLNGTTDGINATLRWNKHPEAAGYNVYKNNNYQTTVTETHYADSLGTNQAEYYVVPFSSSPVIFYSASNTVSVTNSVLDSDSPTTPDGLGASTSDQLITFTWNHSNDNTGVLGYNLYLDGNYFTTVTENGYSFELADLNPDYFQVSAFDNHQNFSELSAKFNLEFVIENDPTGNGLSSPRSLNGVAVNNVGQSIARLSWSSPSEVTLVAGYNIYRDDQYVSSVTSTSFTDSNITSSTHEYYIVAFGHESNFSPRSNVVTVSFTETIPTGNPLPSQATGLSIEERLIGTENSLVLTWNASTDDKGIAGYNIYVNNNYQSSTVNTQFIFSITAPGSYDFYVVAYDRDNNFALPSDTITATIREDESTTPPNTLPTSGAPAAPHNVHGTIDYSGDQATIRLYWSTPPSVNPVISYNIYENNFYLATVNGNSFEKTLNAGELKSYYVIAIDSSQNYSKRSERVRLPDQGNQAPYFDDFYDVTAFAGETVSIQIKPVDPDSDVPGLETGKLPEGMNFLDNRDGTRRLEWRLLEPQVGTHTISITAMDAEDPTLRTTRNLRITVLLPDDLSTIPNLPPAINHIPDHVIRVGDTIVMHVKGTDPNGHIPHVAILNPPENSTFWPYHEEDAITELRWTAKESDKGLIDLWFEATDTRDSSLRYQRKTTLEIKDAAAFDRQGSRLRQLSDQYNLKIGYASLLGFFAKTDSDLYKTIASEEFNIVSSENSMKWSYTNPEPGEYRWDGADNLIRFAAEHNMLVHGHTLVWYSALPQWVLESEVATRENLMFAYIDQMLTRYPNVYVWDVVNEAFEEDGSYRNSIWYQAMGESHIEKAFYRARARDTDTKLIYNDYNISWAGPKSDAVYNLVKSLKEKGVPIDGIGFQMHLDSKFDQFQSMRDTFNRFAALGVDIYITELDVSMTTSFDENQQARVYAEVLAACLEQPRCKALQIWGFTDRYTWLPDYDPLIFDFNYQPKPAYRALQEQFGKASYPWR